MTQSVDNLLKAVESRGLRLANLFQFQVPSTNIWRWQANVTDGLRFWEYGRGETAIEALRAALFVAATTTPAIETAPPVGPLPVPRQPTRIGRSRPSQPPLNIDGIEI